MYIFNFIDDLKHLTAVRSAQHTKFAEENGMSSFLMSAKNGDQVKQTFWKISANLAGMIYKLIFLYFLDIYIGALQC